MFKFSIVQYSSLHIMLHIQFGGPQNSFDLMDKSNVDNVMQCQSVSKVLVCMWTHSSLKLVVANLTVQDILGKVPPRATLLSSCK